VDQQLDQPALAGASRSSQAAFTGVIYVVAFVTGAIVMSFEMLGSRYLNPYFGSGIYTWAALISTVLAALTVGYFLGGWLADRTASAPVLGTIVLVASAYLLALPVFAQGLLEFVLADIDDVRVGSLLSALAIMFFPVTFLGVYSPFAIRLLLRSAQRSGVVSGTVYGVSTAGSIIGTLGTTFFLIPLIGTRAITLSLGAAGAICGLLLIALPRLGGRGGEPRSVAGLVALAALALSMVGPPVPSLAEGLVDESVRAQMLKHANGRVAHVETEYNDIFITKRGSQLSLSTRFKGASYIESVVDLKDPDELPVPYTQIMSVALTYPEQPKRILMIGLGAGSISTYLGRAMPEAQIDVVELDPGLVGAARKYFGLRENDKVRFIESDGRVYLNRHKESYDLILLDAYREAGVPFHLLTREFYTLVKERLAPGGAAAFNINGGTKLYASTLVTLRAVFASVDVYPEFEDRDEAQVIAVATPAPAPSTDTLQRRAGTLQETHKFRYPLIRLVRNRVENRNVAQGELLTDDFAPVNLYETIPLRKRRR
jgi:spermidine synthase